MVFLSISCSIRTKQNKKKCIKTLCDRQDSIEFDKHKKIDLFFLILKINISGKLDKNKEVYKAIWDSRRNKRENEMKNWQVIAFLFFYFWTEERTIFFFICFHNLLSHTFAYWALKNPLLIYAQRFESIRNGSENVVGIFNVLSLFFFFFLVGI